MKCDANVPPEDALPHLATFVRYGTNVQTYSFEQYLTNVE